MLRSEVWYGRRVEYGFLDETVEECSARHKGRMHCFRKANAHQICNGCTTFPQRENLIQRNGYRRT